MREKINVRIAEVELWGNLADVLERREDDLRREADSLSSEVKELYPDGDVDVNVCWQYDQLQKVRAKLKAIDSVRAMILEVMG